MKYNILALLMLTLIFDIPIPNAQAGSIPGSINRRKNGETLYRSGSSSSPDKATSDRDPEESATDSKYDTSGGETDINPGRETDINPGRETKPGDRTREVLTEDGP